MFFPPALAAFPPLVHDWAAKRMKYHKKNVEESHSELQKFQLTQIDRAHDGFMVPRVHGTVEPGETYGPGTMIRRLIAKSKRPTGAKRKSGESHGELSGGRLNGTLRSAGT
jgi:hypothetical protein